MTYDLIELIPAICELAADRDEMITVYRVDAAGYTEELVYSPRAGFLHQRHAPGYCNRIPK